MARKSAANFKKRNAKRPVWVACGFDTSMSSLAGAAIAWDGILGKWKGPVFTSTRWNQGEHYFDRCKTLALAHEHVLSMIGELLVFPEIQNVHIAVEEPWPLGIVKRAQSGWLKQQAQLQGAFLGGLLRWGYQNVYEVNNQTWKNIVKDDMGQPVKDKWIVKQWAIEHYQAPDWPDLIEGKNGKMPKPETSRARAVQPDDRFDALALMEWMRQEVVRQIDRN